MGNFVIAKPHGVVAEPQREDEFVTQHRGPELDLGIVLIEAPQMVTMLEDAGLDRMLEIDAAELMLAGKPRHHLEAKLLARARTLHDSDARVQRVIEMSASANRGADLVERVRIVAEAVSISDDREEILGASQSSQRRGLAAPRR